MSEQACIAVNRFGYGGKLDEITQAKKQPQRWLKKTLTPIVYLQEMPSSIHIMDTLVQNRKLRKSATKHSKKELNNIAQYPRNTLREFAFQSAMGAVQSNNSISWRLLDFFSNHFSVSSGGLVMTALAGTLEREAIAPNILGSFEALLFAVIKHPSMLIYLNNEKSFGENSKLSKRGKGMNENLAREILELHTLGVNGGYNQEDVTELAKGITGWSVSHPNRDSSKGFIFREQGHEPGVRVFLANKYNQTGIGQGEAMLKKLANHPQTAKHICFKLAHHFITDNPPKSLLAKLEKSWLISKGNLEQVMHELIDAQESWHPALEKHKTPRDFYISTLRALNIKKMKVKWMYFSLTSLGQTPFSAGSPAGYPDKKSDWNGASALMARIDWVNSIVSQGNRTAEQVIESSFAQQLTPLTYQTVMRAESRRQSLSLLLLSPEFQRR